jgi:hypothetical protein
VKLAVYADGAEDTIKARYWIEKAIPSFEKGGNKPLEEKARLHLKSIEFRLNLLSPDEHRLEDEKSQARVACLLQQLVQQQMLVEARRLIDSALPRMDEFTRIRLREKMMSYLPDAENLY